MAKLNPLVIKEYEDPVNVNGAKISKQRLPTEHNRCMTLLPANYWMSAAASPVSDTGDQ